MKQKIHETQHVVGVAGGEGPGSVADWVADGERCPNLELCATVTLEPGSTVGEHGHQGEAELYYIITGSGEYNDNGTKVPVSAGDVTMCYDGEMHGLENTGDVPLAFYAVIVKG